MEGIRVDSILSALSADQLRLVEDQLSNNEVSDNEELEAFFMESGLTQIQAIRALKYRDLYLHHFFMFDRTPIREGGYALAFDPKTEALTLLYQMG
jgi:hypothetical protein